MGLLHHLFHSHHGHQAGAHHHRHHHRAGGPAEAEGALFGGRIDGGEHTGRIDHLARKVARRLDLDTGQLSRLQALIESLQQQRQAVRGGDWLQDAARLVDGRAFDRDGAQAMADARIAKAHVAVPAVIDAVAGFYDALDAEQQQVLRFFIRLGRRGGGPQAAQPDARANEGADGTGSGGEGMAGQGGATGAA